MTADLSAAPPRLANHPVDADELVAALRPRLVDVFGELDVDQFVREELVGLGPVRVTTYLPILLERRIRQRFGAGVDGAGQVGTVIDLTA